MKRFTSLVGILLLMLAVLPMQDVKAQDYIKLEAYNVTSNVTANWEGTVSSVVDGDRNSHWHQNHAQVLDDYITVQLEQISKIGNIQLYFSDSDKPKQAVVEISQDDSQWTEVTAFEESDIVNNEYTCNANGGEAQYIRMRLTANSENWLKMREFEVYSTETYPVCSISASAQEGGNVTIDGGTTAVSTEKGATLKATPNQGYAFLYWMVNGVVVSRDATFYVRPLEDTSYKAVFTRFFRLKLKSDGNYLTVAKKNSNDERSFQSKEKVYNSEDQLFVFEPAGDGKSYLKSLSGYYLNCASWNAYARNNGATTPLTVSEPDVDGFVTFYQETSTHKHGYLNIQTKAEWSENGMYCDSQNAGDNAKWAIEKQILIEEGKKYRLRDLSSGLYMQIADYNMEPGRTEGAFLFKELSSDDSQKFAFEVSGSADDSKYYMKNDYNGTVYYVYGSEWNYFAQTEATGNKTEITIIPVLEAIKIYQPNLTGGGYAGNDSGSISDGAKIYNNQPDNSSNIIWVLEEVTTTPFEELIATAENRLNAISAYNSEAYGYYSQETINALATAIDAAKAGESDMETLQNAIDAVHTNIPAVGKFIAFKSASTNGYCKDSYIHAIPTTSTRSAAYYEDQVYTHTSLVFDKMDEVTPSAVFEVIEGANPGEFKLKNVHTQEYVISFRKNDQHMGLENNAVAITLQPLGDGQTAVYGANDSKPMHAQEAYGVIVTWDAALNNASAWNIVDVETYVHTLTVGTAEWSTLVLGFNATIPTAEGFKAYTVSSVEDGYVTLAEATGVLGANTPIIVNAPATNYDFAYTTEAATVTESGLEGTLYSMHIAEEAYVLGVVNEQVGLYKAKYNVSTDTTNDGTEEAPAVTYEAWLNNANKAYLVVPGASEVASYSFRFGEGTTGIDQITDNRVQSTAIYDLTGRKIDEITKPGLYIVDGVKKFVR